MSLKDKFKKASKEVSERLEYIRGDKGILEQKYQETKKISPEDKLGEFRRIAVLGGIDLAWFLFCLGKFAGKDLKTIFVDNKIIDKWKKENENKKVKDTDSRFKQWLNKLQRTYPKTSARLKLWMLYSLVATMVAGGIKLAERDANENTKDSKTEKVIENNEVQHVDWEIENLKLDPKADDDAWEQQVNAVHPYVVAHIFSSEGVILDSYDDNGGEGTLTVGAGFTIDDKIHIDFAERVLQRRLIGTNVHITKSEARLLVDAWLKEVIYPEIKKQFTAPMDYKLFVILSVAAYNKGDKIYADGNSGRVVRDAVNSGQDPENILQTYIRAFGGTEGTSWGGLPNKYGVCALYYSGDIQDSTILKAIAEAPYTLEKYVAKYQEEQGIKATNPGRLLTYGADKRVNGYIVPENIEEMLLKTKKRVTKGTLQEPVKNYLDADEVYKILHGHMCNENGEDIVHLASDDNVKTNQIEKREDFKVLYNKALNLYKKNNYKEAAVEYERLIKLYPDTALLRNDLSLTYNKLGKYAEAIEQAQEVVRRIGDRSQYSAAQYNAGYAYEQLGDYQKALANYKLSLSNGNKSAKGDIKRVQQKIESRKSKVVAFNTSVNKEKNKQMNSVFVLSGNGRYNA